MTSRTHPKLFLDKGCLKAGIFKGGSTLNREC